MEKKKNARGVRTGLKKNKSYKKWFLHDKNAFYREKKKCLRRTHWPQKRKIKKYINIENPIECLLEGGGGWRGRSNGERNEQKNNNTLASNSRNKKLWVRG